MSCFMCEMKLREPIIKGLAGIQRKVVAMTRLTTTAMTTRSDTKRYAFSGAVAIFGSFLGPENRSLAPAHPGFVSEQARLDMAATAKNTFLVPKGFK